MIREIINAIEEATDAKWYWTLAMFAMLLLVVIACYTFGPETSIITVQLP